MESIEEIKSEIENVAETAVEVDSLTETESDCPTQPHNGKKIDKIIVSQYIDDDPYVVTYSKEDNSICRWLVNIEQSGQQLPDAYFRLVKKYIIYEFILYNNILIFLCHFESRKYLFDTKICLKREFFIQFNK
jgi:hypothetical protein